MFQYRRAAGLAPPRHSTRADWAEQLLSALHIGVKWKWTASLPVPARLWVALLQDQALRIPGSAALDYWVGLGGRVETGMSGAKDQSS